MYVCLYICYRKYMGKLSQTLTSENGNISHMTSEYPFSNKMNTNQYISVIFDMLVIGL